jgi:hypothetical protein
MCVGSDECDCHLSCDDFDDESDWDDEDSDGTHLDGAPCVSLARSTSRD